MARGNETFGKKEVRNKKEKKRKEKEKRRLERKEQGKSNLDDMIAYVDENGVISSTPPDETVKKEEIDASSIEVGVPKKEFREEEKTRNGKVYNYDPNKGFGFIKDSSSGDSIFVHVNDCDGDIGEGVKVEFETEKGPKGLKAVNVKVK